VIATDGGADSRDFLTKVQVFSFSLKRPRPSRNTVPVSRLSRVFRVFPPRSSNASGYGCRARFGFRARVLTTIDNRQVSHASRSTSCAFIALRKRISRCEREREREREREMPNESERFANIRCEYRHLLRRGIPPRIRQRYARRTLKRLPSLFNIQQRSSRKPIPAELNQEMIEATCTRAHTCTHRRKEQNLPEILAIYIRRTSVGREGRYIQSI